MPCDAIIIEEEVAELSVSAIDMPSSVTEGEPFDITATVVNTGGASGSGTVEFEQEGEWFDEKDTGSISPGSQTDVIIDHAIEEGGSYEICALLGGAGRCDTINVEDFFTFSSVNQSDLEKCTSGWCTDPDLLPFYTPDMTYDRIEGEMRVYFSGGGEVEAAIIAYDIDEKWVTLGSKMVTSGDWKSFNFTIDKRRLYMICLARADNNGLDLRNGKIHWW